MITVVDFGERTNSSYKSKISCICLEHQKVESLLGEWG